MCSAFRELPDPRRKESRFQAIGRELKLPERAEPRAPRRFPSASNFRLAETYVIKLNARTWTPPTLLGFQVSMACRDRLHPYIRTFAAACAAVPDGIGWLVPLRFFALVVPRSFWVSPTPV
jgi:hypothetical protein